MTTNTQSSYTDNLKATGLQYLSEREQRAVFERLGQDFLTVVMLRLANQLSPEQSTALGQYLETQPDPEQVLLYLQEHYEVARTIITEEIEQLRSELM